MSRPSTLDRVKQPKNMIDRVEDILTRVGVIERQMLTRATADILYTGGGTPGVTSITAGAALIGGGTGAVTIDLNLASPSGLNITADALAIDDSVAGSGLTITSKVLAVGQGAGLTVSANDVALTTPGTITSTSTNTSTGNHTHAIDSTIVTTARTVTAGAGLTGGGALSSNITLNVGAGAGITVNADDVALTTPGTITSTSTNTSTGNHTHAIDSTIAASAITLTAGAGLTGGGNLTANRTFNVGAGLGITVNADDVALTTPGTITSTSTNSSSGNHTHAIDSTIAGSAITLTAGAGLTGGGNLTANRTFNVGAGDGITVNADDVALTTPGSLTATSTNSSVGNHTHVIDSTIARSAITITAGDGLTGGGNLTANRTVTLGTPSTLTVSTSNGVTSTSHTHAITSSSSITTATAVLMATDSSGRHRLMGLGVGAAASADNAVILPSAGFVGLSSSTARVTFATGIITALDANLTVGAGAVAQAIHINGGTGTVRDLVYQTAGNARWTFRTNSQAEASDAGSNLDILRHTSGGAIAAMTIQRSSGLVAFPAGTVVVGTADTPQGYLLIHGNTTGEARGAEVDLMAAADHKATITAWRLAAYEDDFRISTLASGTPTMMSLTPDGYMQVARLGAGIAPAAPIHAMAASGLVSIFERSGSAAVTTVRSYNPDTTNNNASGFDFATDTTGTGATANQQMASILGVVTTHDHATRASRFEFRTSSAGNPATRVTIGLGLVAGSPTGGDKGAGTINAQAVYDDNVLLTDHIFDLHYDGRMRPEDKARYPKARLWSIQETEDFTKKNRHLPTMPGRAEWGNGSKSVGELVTRLWETVEQQQLHIYDLQRQIEG